MPYTKLIDHLEDLRGWHMRSQAYFHIYIYIYIIKKKSSKDLTTNTVNYIQKLLYVDFKPLKSKKICNHIHTL